MRAVELLGLLEAVELLLVFARKHAVENPRR
jgi:hypothetical protein